MSSKFQIKDDLVPHFVTFTVVGWIDVFSRELYKQQVLQSLQYCIDNKGLVLYAWVIMTNHLHLIVSATNDLSGIIRDMKKYTSKKIVKLIEENEQESRKEWMLNAFRFRGRNNINNKEIQFWKQDYHPIQLSSNGLKEEKLNYLHENPVKSGLVWEAWHYKYSSAIDYQTKEHGLLKVEFL